MGLIDFIIGFGFILFALFIIYNSIMKRKGRCAGCNSDCGLKHKKNKELPIKKMFFR